MYKTGLSTITRILLASFLLVACLVPVVASAHAHVCPPPPVVSKEEVKPIIIDYKLQSKVPPTPVFPATVDDSYFSTALFLGNSRTEGLFMQTNLTAQCLATRGLNVDTAYTKAFVNEGDTTVTAMDAVKTREYDKIYIMFGLNEVGWPDESVYIDDYRKIIQDVKTTHPHATIYIQSILPVSQQANNTNRNVDNERIRYYNQLLEQLAAEQGVYYVNVYEVMAVDGVLPPDASVDGIHLNHDHCQIWFDYLKTHAAVLP